MPAHPRLSDFSGHISSRFSGLCSRPLPRLRAGALALGLAFTGIAPAQPLSPPSLPVTALKIGPHAIRAEVADSEDERSRGLMFRNSMPQDQGMLFVFEEPGQYCFWMRNTLIPLSIAFLDDEGRIVDIAEMQAKDDRTHHCPSRPVRMALEMNRGWFRAHGADVGSQVQGLPVLPPTAKAAGSSAGEAPAAGGPAR